MMALNSVHWDPAPSSHFWAAGMHIARLKYLNRLFKKCLEMFVYTIEISHLCYSLGDNKSYPGPRQVLQNEGNVKESLPETAMSPQ